MTLTQDELFSIVKSKRFLRVDLTLSQKVFFVVPRLFQIDQHPSISRNLFSIGITSNNLETKLSE